MRERVLPRRRKNKDCGLPGMNRGIQVVSVVRDFGVYEETTRNNPFIRRYRLHPYDNNRDNSGIPARYNDFIRTRMDRDAWLIFCHQDFGFLEDPWPKLKELPTRFIYGPIGTVRRYGIFFRNRRVLFSRKVLLGRIHQAGDDRASFGSGRYLAKPKTVDTVDCCCLIVHGSLIARHGLAFDENLDFHLYSEDFSLNARYGHGIRTKAVQFECRHLSPCYDVAADFHESLAYLRSKYKGRRFSGTCFE